MICEVMFIQPTFKHVLCDCFKLYFRLNEDMNRPDYKHIYDFLELGPFVSKRALVDNSSFHILT